MHLNIAYIFKMVDSSGQLLAVFLARSAAHQYGYFFIGCHHRRFLVLRPVALGSILHRKRFFHILVIHAGQVRFD